jgi:excinuclease UvrABC nuclease subunit
MEGARLVADPIMKKMSKTEIETSIEHTTELMKKAAKELDFLQAAQYRDEIARIKKELTIVQSVCPHEDTTFDHKDYHKNEDYYKCNTCGMIV